MNNSKYVVTPTTLLVDELALAEARVKEIRKELLSRNVVTAEGEYYTLEIKTVQAKRVRYADLVKSLHLSKQKLTAFSSLRTEKRWFIRAKDGSKAAA